MNQEGKEHVESNPFLTRLEERERVGQFARLLFEIADDIAIGYPDLSQREHINMAIGYGVMNRLVGLEEAVRGQNERNITQLEILNATLSQLTQFIERLNVDKEGDLCVYDRNAATGN